MTINSKIGVKIGQGRRAFTMSTAKGIMTGPVVNKQV